jgi:asparagine synthase (glutamine-hydrolysing)
MCGIAGIFSNSVKENKVEIKRMTDAISHRGPNGEGSWSSTSSRITLGHRRLSIIDLSDNASQPMHYNNGRYTLVFNGEIYNYIEIRNQLLNKGYKFKSDSDTEVLMALYDQKKEKCLSYLNGMFAFALWDEAEQKLFCARDRFGEKPFFFHYRKDHGFFFASEMKALWAVGISRDPDEEMLGLFINDGICLHPYDQTRTFYKQIRQIDSGHYLTISVSDFTLSHKQYYTIDTASVNNKIRFSEAESQFRQLITDSVRLRLRSDVPVGTSLSGGIDSSSIVLLMDEVKEPNMVQKTFSARFKNFQKDEGYYMNMVIQHCKNIKHHEVWPDRDEMEAIAGKILYHQEEPFGSASIFAQWKVMELAKKSGVTVLLDGQGADEQLAGYLYYYTIYLSQLYQNNYQLFTKEVYEYEKLRGIRHMLHPQRQTLKMKLGLLKRSLIKKSVSIPQTHLLNTLRKDMMHTGLKELLRYADRNSMAHSVEVRLPFLDHKLVEFVFSMPDNFKLSNGWTKFLLRKSMEHLLPPEITWRIDKVAYEVPQDNWLADIRTEQSNKKLYHYLSDMGIVDSNKVINTLSNWNYFLLLQMQK